MEMPVATAAPLFVGGALLIPRLRLAAPLTSVIPARNELRAAMEANRYLAGAPFKSVYVTLCYGEAENLNPSEFEIDAKTQCLNVTVQLNGRELAGKVAREQAAKHKLVLIEILCDVAANFDLPFEFLDEMRNAI